MADKPIKTLKSVRGHSYIQRKQEVDVKALKKYPRRLTSATPCSFCTSLYFVLQTKKWCEFSTVVNALCLWPYIFHITKLRKAAEWNKLRVNYILK